MLCQLFKSIKRQNDPAIVDLKKAFLEPGIVLYTVSPNSRDQDQPGLSKFRDSQSYVEALPLPPPQKRKKRKILLSSIQMLTVQQIEKLFIRK